METKSLKSKKWDGIRPMLYDVVIPPAIYFILHFSGVSDITALTVAGLISGGNVVKDFAKNRRFTPLSLLVFIIFAVSIIMSVVIEDPRIILLKPAIFIEIAAIYCLLTTFKRPLLLDGVEPMATDGEPGKIALWKKAWLYNPAFKKRIRIANVLVSIAIGIEGVARAYFALSFSLKNAIIYSNLPIIALILFFALLGRFYMKRTAAIAFEGTSA